jgi:hypothetical protein
MNAVVLSRYGFVEWGRHPLLCPRDFPNATIVKVVSASINDLDARFPSQDLLLLGRMISGYASALTEPFLGRYVLGKDLSGVVVQSPSLPPGTEVFAALSPLAVRGAMAEVTEAKSPSQPQFAIVDEEYIAPKPPSLSFDEAAAVPFAALTAWVSCPVVTRTGVAGAGGEGRRQARRQGLHSRRKRRRRPFRRPNRQSSHPPLPPSPHGPSLGRLCSPPAPNKSKTLLKGNAGFICLTRKPGCRRCV